MSPASTPRAKRSPLRRLLVTSAVAVAALAGPAAGQALAASGHFSISDEHIAEGNSGSRFLNFTITYHRVDTTTPSTGTVQWATADLTANAGSDFLTSNGSETLTTTQTAAQPGGSSATKVISVPIIGDTADEGPEIFRVTLFNAGTPAAPLGYTTDIVDAEGLGTIDNDDAPVATPPAPVEDDDDDDAAPVIITVPQAQPLPQPAPAPQPQQPQQPVNVTVQAPAAAQPQPPVAPQPVVVQQAAATLPAKPNSDPVEVDDIGPTVGMKFNRLTNAARVQLRCPVSEKSCAGRLQLQLQGRTLGSARFKMAGGASRWVNIRLSRSERRALRRVSGFYLRAVTLDAAGNRQSTTRGFSV